MDPSNTLTLGVTLAVLGAAVTHAVWNAIAHGIKDQTLAFALIGAGSIGAVIPLIVVSAVPRAAAWPYLLASVGIHVFYNLLLMQCYRLGEFSQVYPLARGISPPLVTFTAAIFIHEHLSFPAARGRGRRLDRAGVPDLQRRPAEPRGGPGRGRHRPDHRRVHHRGRRRRAAVRQRVRLHRLADAAAELVRPDVRPDPAPRRPAQAAARILLAGLAAGALSVVAYGLVLWAQTQGALAPIAALRETSVIFGAIIGALAFREPFGRVRITATVIVVAGILLQPGRDEADLIWDAAARQLQPAASRGGSRRRRRSLSALPGRPRRRSGAAGNSGPRPRRDGEGSPRPPDGTWRALAAVRRVDDIDAPHLLLRAESASPVRSAARQAAGRPLFTASKIHNLKELRPRVPGGRRGAPALRIRRARAGGRSCWLPGTRPGAGAPGTPRRSRSPRNGTGGLPARSRGGGRRMKAVRWEDTKRQVRELNPDWDAPERVASHASEAVRQCALSSAAISSRSCGRTSG